MASLILAFVFLLGPVGAGLVAAVLVTASVQLRMVLATRRVRRELEARLDRGSEGVVRLRGKLVVEGDGCAAEVGEGSRAIGARTHWGSLRRFWLHDALPSTNERAEKLWLETGKEKVRIEGALAVDLGSALTASGARSFIDKRKRFDIRATLADGDMVLVLGKRREEGDDVGLGGGYRKGASRGVLEPLPEAGFLRARAVAPSRIAQPLRALARHPAVIGALVFGLLPGIGAAKDYARTAEDLDFYCKSLGHCHVDSTLRWEGLHALRAMYRANYFVLKAHDESECRTSSSCMQFGLCSLVDGECVALDDRDCELSVYCANGACSAVDGVCAIGKDADCRRRSFCAAAGLCSARNLGCVAATAEDCRSIEACREHGECTPKDGQCVAATDEDCAHSEVCTGILHHCTAVDGSCAPSDRDCRATTECAARGECAALGGTCVPATNEDCQKSAVCAAHQKCRFSSEGGSHVCVVTGETCAASDSCRVHGRCGGTSHCEAISDRDCAQSTNCKTEGACKRFGEECAASCESTLGCREVGECTLSNGLCVVGGDADCRKSDVCRRDGGCAFVDGSCRLSDADCAKTEACRVNGRCSASSDGRDCLALNAADCKASEACKTSGACKRDVAGSCRPESDADCAASPACKSDGLCTYLDGSCVVGPDYCKSLSACKDRGECTASPGTNCAVASDADCRDSTVCKRSGWCSNVGGHCFHH